MAIVVNLKGMPGAVVAGLCLACLSGCALQRAYAGPELPRDEVALLVTAPQEQLLIETVDGASVSGAADRYEILPGHHALRIRALRQEPGPQQVERTSLNMEAEPGHTYRLRGIEDPTTSRWTGRLEDAGPMERASSAPPDALENACRSGVARDCVELGGLHEHGTQEVAWREATAASLYQQACKAGDPEGCFRFAGLAEVGHGLARDERRAASLYDRACQRGEQRACTRLAALAEEGRGIPKDDRRAASLYEEACRRGEAAACYRQGTRAREGVSGAADYGLAAKLFDRACELGEPQACTGLGLLSESGLGVDQDEARAGALYGKACEAGSALGCGNLGVLHLLGMGVPRDIDRAVALLRKGCARGAASACTTLEGLGPIKPAPPPAPAPASAPAQASCVDVTPTGSHVPVQLCSEEDPVAALAGGQESGPARPGIENLRVGVRGEGDLLQPGFLTGIWVEWFTFGDRLSVAGTFLVRWPPGGRLELKYYPLEWGRLRPYAALGTSLVLFTLSGRGAVGADFRVLQFRAFQLHLFADLAWEHFFNARPTYAPDSLLLSGGAGWRF